MKKLFTLLILLGLLPVTALAAGGAPSQLYVGNQLVISGSDITYWTTNDSGELERSNLDSWNVKYDPNTATLTLSGATIKGGSNVPYGAGIYALSSSNQPVALTIELIGENTITGNCGIYVNADQGTTPGADASLVIKNGGDNGDNGILTVTGTDNSGLLILSGTGGASLTIKNASVDAKTTQTYSGYAGVCVQSGLTATNSPNISLSVDGGSLTASGTESRDGILFYVGSSQATGATTSLTVSNNAIVDARNGGISASKTLETLPTPTPTGDNRSGIVFDGSTGTVYGSVALQDDLTIGAGETLTVPSGSSLNCNGKLTNNGTILASGGTVTGSLSGGSTVTTPSISQQPTGQTVTEGSAAEFSITATAGSETPTYQWQQSTDSGSSWTAINDATEASYTINSTTTSMSGNQYRCVVKSASGVSVISSAATLTVNQSVTPTSYSISADVAPAGAGTVTVNGSGTSATVTANSDVTLTATANDGYRFTGWMENDQRVSTDATYTFKATGDRTLTAKFEKKVTGVKLNTETLELFTGGSVTLTATVQPSDATNQNVTWQSNNANVATVEGGTVTAVGAGETTITVKTQDGNHTATCQVTVTQSTYGISANPTVLDFGNVCPSYTRPAAKTVTITNTGNQDLTLNQPASTKGFEVGNLSTTSLPVNGTATFTVQPEADLPVGTYSENITVSGSENVTVTITASFTVRKELKVEPSGSTNLSFTTDRDEFTLTATVHAQGNDLDPKDDSWTWTVADKDVVALSGSPTWRSQSYSISRQTFTVEGTGTTTITATYDDGTYRGSVVFTVRISKPTPPDPISYYNIYVEEVCDGVEVTLSNTAVREGNSISVYVEKDTANYTFDNFHVYYKKGYYDSWNELPEGVQPGEYPIHNIWNHIYIKALGAEEKEDPTGIEQVEGVKVYTKDGSLYVQTPQREQVLIITMTGVVVKNEEQVGLKQYHGLQPGIYIVRVGERTYKLRL